MVEIKLVTNQAELEGVLALQQANLRKNITQEEAESQGFLMAEYDLPFLKLLHKTSPGIIAKDGEKVVGYSLVALPETARHHELLADLVENIERCIFDGKPVENYAIVAQLYMSEMNKLMRNDIDYSSGNVTTNLVAKRIKHLSELVRFYQDRFRTAAKEWKISENVSAGFFHY